MNQSHAVAGVSGVSTTAMLATVLQHFQSVDTATASAEAGLIVLILGAFFGLVQMMMAHKPQPAPVPAPQEPPHAAPGQAP